MMDNNFWLGDEHSASAFLRELAKHNATPTKDLQDISVRAMTEAAEMGGEFGEFSYMVSKVENLAVVDISGSLTAKNRPYNRMFGMVSYDEIRNAVFSAVEDESVDGIVLNMDTPGGQASGVSELSDFLSEVDANVKPIYTYAGTTMASGGYWLGSVGREIYASKLATVGSIGVVTVHASYEKMYEEQGIDVTVLRAGEFKALGSPYEKLDDKSRSQIQSQMDTIYDVFLETVAENRGTSVNALKETSAEGRVFVGEESVAVGLVDNITSFDAAIADISSKVKSSSRRPLKTLSETTIGVTDMPGKKKVLTEAGVAAIESGVPEAEVLSNPEMVEEVDDKVEDTPTEEADTSVEEGAESEEDQAEAEEADDSEDPAPAAASSNGLDPKLADTMFNKISDLTTELATVKAELATANAAMTEAKAAEEALVNIAIASAQKMEVSLGGSPSKLTGMATAVVLDHYNRVHTQFCQRFKVGATAQVPEDADFDGASEGNTTLGAAIHRLTDGKVKSK